MSVNMKETHDKIKKGKLEFQVIYSRKIEGSVAAFTGVIFAFQYGLTRETVAENFSRTGIDWSEFILYVSVGLLLIFLFWNDDYILSTEGVTFRRVIFYKKHKWSEFPYCGVCYYDYKYSIDKNEKLLYFSKKPESDRKFEERYNTIEYTPEVEAIFQIYHPQMPDPDWEFWKNELKDTKIWKKIDVNNYKRKIFKYDLAQSVHFLPVVCVLKFASNYYVPVAMIIGAIAFTYTPFVKRWHNKIKELTREYQRAALCQLVNERQEGSLQDDR